MNSGKRYKWRSAILLFFNCTVGEISVKTEVVNYYGGYQPQTNLTIKLKYIFRKLFYLMLAVQSTTVNAFLIQVTPSV